MMQIEREKEVLQEIEKQNTERLYRVLLTAEVYADDKKALKQLLKIVKTEQKKASKNKVFMPEEISVALVMKTEDIVRIFKELLSADSVERYNRGQERLREYKEKLREQLEPKRNIVDDVVQDVKNAFGTAKQKLKQMKDAVKSELFDA